MNFSRTKIWTILAICILGLVFVIPNLLPQRVVDSLPSWVPSHRVNLGLDLQGGSQLLLEIDMNKVLRDRLTNLADGIRTAMRTQRIPITNLSVAGTDSVTFRVREPGQVEQARNAVREIEPTAQISVADGTITVRFNQQDLIEQRQRAIAQSIEIVRRRIDETGTKEVSIAAQGQTRILVQLPGVREPERIKELIGKTAKMDFHLLDVNNSVADAMAGRVPPGSVLMPSDNEVEANGQPRMYLVQRRVMVAGDRLIDARPSMN